jgi:hypothetical protein
MNAIRWVLEEIADMFWASFEPMEGRVCGSGVAALGYRKDN